MQQDDFDRREKCLLWRQSLSTQPLTKICFGYLKMLRQLLDAPEHQAGPMKRARVDARMLGGRQRAIFRCC